MVSLHEILGEVDVCRPYLVSIGSYSLALQGAFVLSEDTLTLSQSAMMADCDKVRDTIDKHKV